MKTTHGRRPGDPVLSTTDAGPDKAGEAPSPRYPAPPALAPSVPRGAICLRCREPILTGGVRISGECWVTHAHRGCAGVILEILAGP